MLFMNIIELISIVKKKLQVEIYWNQLIYDKYVKSVIINEDELKNITQYTSRNKNINLIGVTSKKDSVLYKNSDVTFQMPPIKEAGPENIVPTSSTSAQLALGDAIAIACMRYNNFTKLDFKKFHPGGSLSIKLKTVSDLMITGNKIPFVDDVRRFDARILTVDATPASFFTVEKKRLIVDSYAKWKIADVETYYKATGGVERVAENRLARRVNDGLRNQFGTRTLREVVSGERDILMQNITEDQSLTCILYTERIRFDTPVVSPKLSKSLPQR